LSEENLDATELTVDYLKEQVKLGNNKLITFRVTSVLRANSGMSATVNASVLLGEKKKLCVVSPSPD
jgi:hypothetical protein